MMADLESSFDGRGVLTHRMVAAVQGYIMTMDIEGARRRSHEPTAVRPELGLGWTGSKAETRSGPGRAGPRSKMYRWRLVTFECQQTTVTELFRNDSTHLLRFGS